MLKRRSHKLLADTPPPAARPAYRAKKRKAKEEEPLALPLNKCIMDIGAERMRPKAFNQLSRPSTAPRARLSRAPRPKDSFTGLSTSVFGSTKCQRQREAEVRKQLSGRAHAHYQS